MNNKCECPLPQLTVFPMISGLHYIYIYIYIKTHKTNSRTLGYCLVTGTWLNRLSSVRKSVSVVPKRSLSHSPTSGHSLLPLCHPLHFCRLLKPDQILKQSGIIYHYWGLSAPEQSQQKYCCQMLCIIKLQSQENILRAIVLPKKVRIVK